MGNRGQGRGGRNSILFCSDLILPARGEGEGERPDAVPDDRALGCPLVFSPRCNARTYLLVIYNTSTFMHVLHSPI
jgi:hypothetical protein